MKLCEPVDGSDTRYLKQSLTSIVNPFKKSVNIELYSETLFSKPPAISCQPFLHNHNTLSFPSDAPSHFPILVSFHKDTNTSPSTPLLDDGINIDISPPSSFSLYESILRSNGLFFIQYTPENTLKSLWVLV